jgi:hypothetical protein
MKNHTITFRGEWSRMMMKRRITKGMVYGILFVMMFATTQVHVPQASANSSTHLPPKMNEARANMFEARAKANEAIAKMPASMAEARANIFEARAKANEAIAKMSASMIMMAVARANMFEAREKMEVAIAKTPASMAEARANMFEARAKMDAARAEMY